MNSEDLTQLLSVGESEPIAQSDARVAHLAQLSQAMGTPPPDKDAPAREVLARLGDNWSALILKVLAGGEYRHATLKRVIAVLAAEGEISQRMLTLRLRALERDGFVSRREEATVPPRVYYALTPLGQELDTLHSQLIDWIIANDPAIQKARANFTDEQS
jgi:DNA-binding HxlR family transcriptional regulator